MQKTADKGMYWIRNLSRIKKGAPSSWIEYELASEARINGVLNYANSAILCSPLTLAPDSQGLFKYLLKVKVAHFDQDKKLANISRKGYVLREGLLGELVSILSLALETRFFVVSSSIGELGATEIKIRNDYSILHRPCTIDIDPVIMNPKKRNFRLDVRVLLDLVASIGSKYHNEIILAFYHYEKALREIAIDDEMVFIRLISAIEVVARRMPVSKSMDILACRKLSEIIREDRLSPEEQEEARKIFNVRYSKCHFISFLNTYSKGFFKRGRPKAEYTRILKADLHKVAATIYNARSSYLHAGIPMYLSTRIRGKHRWHTDPSSGMVLGSRRFVTSEKLPYPHFFHPLVRHCLLNYCNSLSGFEGNHLKYFAYGSNMLHKRLQERVASAHILGPAKLLGYRLAWHKKSKDKSGKCAVEKIKTPSHVWGVLYKIDPSEKGKLDKAEGLGFGYEEKNIVLEFLGTKTQAITYYATSINHSLQPYHWYKKFVVEGAKQNGLPNSYILDLERKASIIDPDQLRAEKNNKILSGI